MNINNEWTIEDEVSGLSIKILPGEKLDRLQIRNSDSNLVRDFWFTKDGDFDGTGAYEKEVKVCPKMAKKFDKVKDSGEEQSFGTGAVRDIQSGKGRFDLLPPYALLRIAKHFENGANRYQERNWEKGIPCSRYLDSAFRHMIKIMMGLDDEDHESACCWNLLCLIETKARADMGILPEELNDLPTVYSEHFDEIFGPENK